MIDATVGSTETAAGGEVTVTRRLGGEFIVTGSINGKPARARYGVSSDLPIVGSARTTGAWCFGAFDVGIGARSPCG